MQEVSYQEIFKKKLERQDRIKELEFHVHGSVPHVGPISPGCAACMSPDTNEGGGVFMGRMCQFNCPYCYYDFKLGDETDDEMVKKAHKCIQIYRNHTPKYISFVSNGETLLYLDKLKIVADDLNKIEDEKGVSIYRHLYTNGVLADEPVLEYLKEMRVDEIRFHFSASGFNPKVLENMRLAKQHGFIVTVEEPGWPPIKEKLFSYLPQFDGLVTYFNIIEMWVTKHNIDRVSKLYPQGKYYKDYLYHLWDEGMVYDLIEEKIKNNYSFSVLDCNSHMEKYRQFQEPTAMAIFDPTTLQGMTAPFDATRKRDD